MNSDSAELSLGRLDLFKYTCRFPRLHSIGSRPRPFLLSIPKILIDFDIAARYIFLGFVKKSVNMRNIIVADRIFNNETNNYITESIKDINITKVINFLL